MDDRTPAPNYRPDSKIAAVYHFPNGMVAVTDQYGHQMPEFQGKREEVEPLILAAGWTCGFQTKWTVSDAN